MSETVPYSHGTTVRRDVSTGGRSILVEALRDASGRTLTDVDAELRGLRRSKWRLGVWPGVFERKLLDGCEWLLSTQRGPSAVLVSVKAPTGRMVFAACPATDSLDSLKVTVEVFPLAPGKPPVLVQLGADPADTVETLRWGAVFKSTPIPKGHRAIGLVAQNPSFGLFMEDRELPLKGTVAECGITSGARLCFRRRDSDLDSRKMQIFVKFMRSSTTIHCFEWDTVQAVKDRVGLETASKEMYLMMRAPLEDELTLCESGVGDQSFLHLMLRIRGGGSSSSSVGAAQPAGQAQAGPEGAQPIASATPPAQPTDTLAVGKIVAGKFLPPEKTRTCHFHIDDEGPAPKLQFDIFVDEA